MSEEMILAYVENKKLPRGELTFLTWLLSKSRSIVIRLVSIFVSVP